MICLAFQSPCMLSQADLSDLSSVLTCVDLSYLQKLFMMYALSTAGNAIHKQWTAFFVNKGSTGLIVWMVRVDAYPVTKWGIIVSGAHNSYAQLSFQKNDHNYCCLACLIWTHDASNSTAKFSVVDTTKEDSVHATRTYLQFCCRIQTFVGQFKHTRSNSIYRHGCFNTITHNFSIS